MSFKIYLHASYLFNFLLWSTKASLNIYSFNIIISGGGGYTNNTVIIQKKKQEYMYYYFSNTLSEERSEIPKEQKRLCYYADFNDIRITSKIKNQNKEKIIRLDVCILSMSLHQQDAAQGQFLSGVLQVGIQIFLLLDWLPYQV